MGGPCRFPFASAKRQPWHVAAFRIDENRGGTLDLPPFQPCRQGNYVAKGAGRDIQQAFVNC